MAYHLLQHDRAGAEQLAQALAGALSTVRRCARCHNFTEEEVCALCRSPRRDASLLCVVETPADLAVVEQTLSYSGMYFVLMGRLSPLDGVGARDIGLDQLLARATDGEVQEVILATNFTNEGEATAHYIAEMLRARDVKVSGTADEEAGAQTDPNNRQKRKHGLQDPALPEPPPKISECKATRRPPSSKSRKAKKAGEPAGNAPPSRTNMPRDEGDVAGGVKPA